jgi:hypothetical protein
MGELLPVAVLCAASMGAGCGSTERAPAERGGLDAEYMTVEGGDTCRVLVLHDDGGFVVTERERDTWCDRAMRARPAPVATGTWTLDGGRLCLEGTGWTVAFETDSTRVEIPARSDILSSLRWVTSSGGSPFSACDLVSASEFDEFLHPTEGSGSSTGW